MFGVLNSRFFKVYIVPGAVFQSVMVGGGYGTGREIIEYFTSHGFLGGVFGLLIAFACMAVVIALTFEFSRLFKAYDYRNFFKQLLGPGWIVFEILLILLFLLILAVLAAAAGNIMSENFGIPYGVGLTVMLLIIGVLTFFGRDVIAKMLTYWSIFLYAVFLSFFIVVFNQEWPAIQTAIEHAEVLPGWWQSGFKYAMYNIAVTPLLLYVAREFDSRKEAVTSGVIAAAIAMFPALIFQVAFFAAYPEIIEQPIPVYWMMGQLGMSVLLVLYSVMLFGTFIETGAGMLQGINERIDAWLIEKRGQGLARPAGAAIAMIAIAVSAVLSLWGITSLIAEGYSAMSYGFLLVYVLPLLTIGVYKIIKANKR